MGTQSRSKSVSPVPSTSCARESSGEATSDDPHALVGASGQPSRPHKNRPPSPPFTFRLLRRPLRQGERLLLTLLAEQCVDAYLRQDQERRNEDLMMESPQAIYHLGKNRLVNDKSSK